MNQVDHCNGHEQQFNESASHLPTCLLAKRLSGEALKPYRVCPTIKDWMPVQFAVSIG
jgi:hypothetical protein